MTRLEAIDKLCESYSVYFDVERFEENEDLLAATCFCMSTRKKYVLVKAAKLWEADSNEYVYIFNVPHLTKDVFTKCRDYAHKDGDEPHRAQARTHVFVYYGAVYLIPTRTPCVRLKRTRIYKSFRLSYYGWMDFHTGLIELQTGKDCRKRQWKKYSTAFEKKRC